MSFSIRSAGVMALALAGTALAVPLQNAQAPLTADVPAGWEQRPYPNNLPGVMVVAPGNPPPAVLQLFYAPYQGKANDAKALKEFMGGVEGSMTGGGLATIKRLSDRPRTVGGVKGLERSYDLTLKANGAVVRLQLWYGVSARNLLSVQATTGPTSTAAQKAVFEKTLKSIKFK
ncbi:hypothetical protein [Deinococcus arenicola]|uniref:DUF1795 domain-containing protein n=1 Tax=Deinococcus arenicola TaxID=2994950 RepID=A0ABU4DT81_9DEIO|nr:hypothetical protein [Deinococcus sp. ZS9-10]MDV6375583.1 hypothetical protein [Deinococcus sp. ZS9-10]